uniref:Trans-1,2-dihydrobenzene-1,2-diol dehydrogenase n=1 Tax=Scylla olivacea TaxID=85551 RepID=A0A0P4W2Q3_SCYOL
MELISMFFISLFIDTHFNIQCMSSSNADVVYIGTIQTYHLPVATEMLKAGKAVLCEKPLCMNVRETRQLIQTAQECGVFFMEVRLTKMVGRESGFHYVSNVSFLLLHQNVIETV